MQLKLLLIFPKRKYYFASEALNGFYNDFKIDVVAYIKIIEQVDNSVEFLKNIHHLLSEKGILSLSTLNAFCFKKTQCVSRNSHGKDEYEFSQLIKIYEEVEYIGDYS